MFLSVITENLKWEILTKNLVTFKRWDGVKDEKFQYYAGLLKIRFIGGSQKTTYSRKFSKKRGSWAACIINGGAWQKRGAVFLRGVGSEWYPNAHYKLGNNFNCDFNLLMSISSLLIWNKKSTILQSIGY